MRGLDLGLSKHVALNFHSSCDAEHIIFSVSEENGGGDIWPCVGKRGALSVWNLNTVIKPTRRHRLYPSSILNSASDKALLPAGANGSHTLPGHRSRQSRLWSRLDC